MLKSPYSARASFEQVAKDYPTSPFVDDALIAAAEAGVMTGDLPAIESAREQLKAMKAAPEALQKVQFQVGEFYSKAQKSRVRAIREYRRAYREYPANTAAGATAKIRAADLVPSGDFAAATTMYAEVLREHPKLEKSQRDWAQLHIGIYSFQQKKLDEARGAFEKVLAGGPSAATRAMAERYLKGMSEPLSPESVIIHYDRAVRFKQVGNSWDEAFFDMQQVLSKCQSAELRNHFDSAKVDRETRAEMLYREAFAHFWCSHSRQAYELAGEILDKVKPQGVTREQCLHMRAYLLGYSGRHAQAIEQWKKLIDENPTCKFLPDCYLELGRSLDFSGDKLGAIFAFEELAARFPATIQAERARQSSATIRKLNPQLTAEVEKQLPILVQKWKPRPPDLSPGILETDVAVVSASNPTGGAE